MEVDKLEMDDESPLILELTGTDPLFKRKKKLLEDMGFDPEGSMKLKRYSNTNELKHVLDELLQRARIINLNDVELYFAIDAMYHGDCISPRNELQALSSILELIDKLRMDENCTITNMEQILRNEIVDRIHEVGGKFGNEIKIIEGSLCDKEKSLVVWGVNNGVKTKLDIAYVGEAGRGAVAKEDLEVGDVALEIPLSVIISGEILYESDMFPILEEVDGISEETMLLLWSMKEKHKKDSKFKLYFGTLPEKFNTGLSFGIDAVMALDGTLLLEEIVQAKEHLHAQYNELFPALSHQYPDVFPPELYTWEQFSWACELWYSNSMKVVLSDGKPRTCLIPIAGFLNHSICPHITHYGRIDTATNSLGFPLSRPCRAGEQCFLSYGSLSSSHLLTFYGFLPQGDNPYDVIPLDIDVAQVEDSDGGVPAPEWSSHMVRGTWLSKNHEIFHYGLPHPLLDHLRSARNPFLQFKRIVSPITLAPDLSITKNIMDSDLPLSSMLLSHLNDCFQTRELLESELDMLRDMNSTFDGMMEGLSDENLDHSETTSWDVKFALEYKSLQRRIVYSIIKSCKAGLELLESELLKSTV